MKKRLRSSFNISRYFFLFFLLSQNLFPQSGEKKTEATIAVLPLKTMEKKTTPETLELTNWVIFKSFALGIKNILDFEETQKILKADDRLDFESCSFDSCIYAVGARLQVAKIIWGNIASDDVQHTLILYLGDVAEKKLINSVTIQIKGTTRDMQNHLTPALQRLFIKSGTTYASSGTDTPREPIQPPQPASKHSQIVTIQVLSQPTGALVYIDGKKVGITPYKADSLPAGSHDITLDLYGYQQFSKTFTLSGGAQKKYLIKLSKRFGGLAVLSHPPGASVVLNSDTLGQTPFFSDTLNPGTYTLNCLLPKYVPVTRPVTIVRSVSDTISVKLTSQAYIDSLKQVKHRKGRLTRRIIFGTLAAGFAGLGVYYNREVQQELDKLDAAYANYNQPGLTSSQYKNYYKPVEEALKETDSLKGKRNAFFIIGGAFAVAFGISIPF